MANKVANVDDVTVGIGSLAAAEPASSEAHRLPAPHAMPANMLRSHLHRVPEKAAVVAESVIAEETHTSDVTASSFAAKGQAAVGTGVITAMAANAFDGRLYVANYADDSVSVLDGYTLAVVSTIAGTPEPYALAVARGRAYVSTVVGAYDALAVTDAESVVATHSLADTVQDVVVDREGRYAYVARTGRGGADVAVINTATGAVNTVDLHSRSGEVANTLSISGDGRTLFVATTDQLSGRLVIVDTAQLRVVDALTVVEPIRGLAASHDGATVWVATDDATAHGLVDALDTRSHRLLASVEIGSAVKQLMLSAVGDRVYAVTDEAVVVVCANTYEVVDTIVTPWAPSCVAESVDGSRLYVAGFDGRVALYSVASTTPSLLARMATPEALAGPAARELARAGV